MGPRGKRRQRGRQSTMNTSEFAMYSSWLLASHVVGADVEK
jgi:hypothetical protein